jgi:hypothetical protein
VIAGKILAAVLTTTSAVTGLCGANILSAAFGKKHKSNFKSGLMNLGANSYEVMNTLDPEIKKNFTDPHSGYDYVLIPNNVKNWGMSTRIDYDGRGKTL